MKITRSRLHTFGALAITLGLNNLMAHVVAINMLIGGDDAVYDRNSGFLLAFGILHVASTLSYFKLSKKWKEQNTK